MNIAFIYATLAFVIWGSFPIVFDLLRFASTWEILFHRIIWSAIFIAPITLYAHKISPLQLIKRVKADLSLLILSALLISLNWLVFVYAVLQGRVLETSLGYFLSPLCSIFIGMVFFQEKLDFCEKIALLLVILALFIKTINHQGIPWISIGLALTFSAYGAVHKRSAIPSDISLTTESWLLMPLSFAGLFFCWQQADLSYGKNMSQSLGLMSMGVVTITPLWLFSRAAKGMKLAQLGFFNYLTPSMTFVLGLWYFNEVLMFWTLVSFVLIWLALGLMSWHKLRSIKT